LSAVHEVVPYLVELEAAVLLPRPFRWGAFEAIFGMKEESP
jgi:hypothetical protein